MKKYRSIGSPPSLRSDVISSIRLSLALPHSEALVTQDLNGGITGSKGAAKYECTREMAKIASVTPFLTLLS